eukprot:8385013-Alexandrium_andersonii.AAC.1
MPTSMKTYMWLSPRRYPSRGCAPSCGVACMAPGRHRRGGRPCTRRLWRASGLSGARPARAASSTRSWTC